MKILSHLIKKLISVAELLCGEKDALLEIDEQPKVP